MRIERIELRQIAMPLVRPFATRAGSTGTRQIILVRVLDTDGVEAWGECVATERPVYTEEWTESAWPVLERVLAPMIVHKPFETAREVRRIFEPVHGNRMAKAAIEMACADLQARHRNIPLAELLGGTRSEIASGVSIGLQPTTAALLETIERELAAGYQRIKVKIEPDRDLAVIEPIRERFPDVPLMADANSAYTLNDVPLLRRLDAFALLMIEQPLGRDDIADHARLQKEIATPVCLDESIRSAADARLAIELHACRVINLKPGRVGGYAESLEIETLCREHGIGLWCGGMLESGIGRAHNIALASLAGFTLPGDISASERYWSEDVVEPPVKLSGRGTIAVPSGPGIGVDVRRERIESLTVRSAVIS